MKKIPSLIVMAALAMFAFNSFAAGPNGPKPKCPMGQLPVLEQGMWQCQEAKIKAKEHGMESSMKGSKMMQHGQAASAGEKPRCPKGQLPKMENGHWKCEEMSITAPQKPQQQAAGDRPRCPKGQIPKMENGQWMCKELGLTAPGNPDAQAAKIPKPRCPMGQLPKFEDGQWVCRQPGYSAGGGDQE